jgi:hypothetical protein
MSITLTLQDAFDVAIVIRVNKTVDDRFPRFNKNRPVNRSNRPVYRACEYIGTVLGWEPDRFVYRAGPVPPRTGRTGPVPTGFANPGCDIGLLRSGVVWSTHH